MRPYVLLLSGLVVALVVSLLRSNDPYPLANGSASTSSSDPAHMMLVMQWGESLCASQKRGCHGPIHPHFTLHGLWPLARHSVNCRADFDALQLDEIASNLTRMWPSYVHNTHGDFHKHEYNKHGSCLYPTVGEYFAAALLLQREHELLRVLRPGAHVRTVQEMSDLIVKGFGVQPMLRALCLHSCANGG